MASELLTPRQMADQLGVSSSTVSRWARLGLIPSVKLPGQKQGRYRFSQDTVDQLLAGLQPGEFESPEVAAS